MSAIDSFQFALLHALMAEVAYANGKYIYEEILSALSVFFLLNTHYLWL